MKTHMFIAFLIMPFLVNSQTTAIPDPVFESELIASGIDTNGMTGNILNSDTEGVINLFLRNKGISDLTGIEAFVDLVMLDCEDNLLTTLDLTYNTNLNILDCNGNQLNNLNISANTMLEQLACMDNDLTTLNLSNNTMLSTLSCYNNQLEVLDLTNNSELYQIVCHDNELTNITFPSTQNNLQIVWCYNNQLTNLDLTTAPALATLRFENNQLTFLDLRNGNNTNIHTMDARGNPNLELICVDNIGYSNSAINWTKDTTANYSESCTLSLEKNESETIKIYPNPTKYILTITSTTEPLKEVKIYNNLGQLKDIKTETLINLSNYSAGIYFIKIETVSGKQTIHKIIIN
ncbi:T9SS type A sorting domain-containing protein [Sabulilitoribacter multivorans]|uniref:T9SS type A sorting domain-containing protein n=1 Tax=Flaviramulus multivorans TaxID=1304750 RepID=A0ABS9IL55_9FLAO|nr:T9SS type A sorting domain-containing protein [Flaviramulus multivorans]MCF7561343.1 T9SS type A sorting domain-containing protein [Flaviramulus multivorans]